MKRWKIEIVATDEAEASKILRTMANAFEIAANHKLPLNFLSMDSKGNKEVSTVELIKP